MKATATALITIAALFLTGSAWAYDLPGTLQAIDSFAMQTGIDSGQTALLKTFALADPDRLPDGLRIDEEGPAFFCATPLVLQIRELALDADPAVREMIQVYLPVDQPEFGPLASLPKVGPAENPDGFFTSNTYKTDHFNIKWGPDSTLTQPDIEAWGVILEDIWDTEVVLWGFDPVYRSDEYFVDMYLGNSGDSAPDISGASGYTTIYAGTGQPYIVIDPQMLASTLGATEVNAHEFFHTLQMTVAATHDGCASYMMGNTWAVEGTATWASDEAYPDNDIWLYIITSYAENPQHRLDAVSDFGQNYSRVLWWVYLEENFGGRPAIFDLWNDGCHSSLFDATDNVLSAFGESVRSVFPDFARANLYSDYVEGDEFPEFVRVATVETYPTTVDPGDQAPEILGANYIDLLAPTEPLDGPLVISFDGVTETHNRAFDWEIQVLAETAGTKGIEELSLEVTDGKGELEVIGFGEDYDAIHLIITPLMDKPDHADSAAYTVTVGPAEEEPDDDDDDTADDDDDAGDDDDDDDDSGSCCG
jgi:Family of unknown function (DUF6055)